MNDRLGVSRAAKDGLLEGIGAPAVSDADWDRLVRKLARIGAELPLAPASPPGSQRETLAVGFGDASGWLARAYARMAGTSSRTIYDQPREIAAAIRRLKAEHPSATLFFLLPSVWFDTDQVLCAAAASLHSDVPCGFLPLDADPAAALFQIARLAALALRQRPYPNRLLAFADFIADDGDAGYFGKGSETRFLSRLALGAFGAVFSAHCNGADLRLGSRVLCAQTGHLAPASGLPGEVFLPCQAGGPCLREPAFSRTGFHGPDAFRSAAVVMLVCNGIVPAGGIVDPRFSFSAGLFRGRHVRSVVSASRYVMTSAERLTDAVTLLSGGASTGELALHLNRRMASSSPAYVCLGDPGTVLPRSLSGKEDAPPRVIGFPSRGEVVAELTDYLLAAEMLSGLLASADGETALLEATLEDLRLVSALLLRDSVSVSPETVWGLDERLAVALAFLLAANAGEDLFDIISASGEPRVNEGPPCEACGQATRIKEYGAMRFPAAVRWRTVCPFHGLLSDVPIPPDSPGNPDRPRAAAVSHVGRDGRLAVSRLPAPETGEAMPRAARDRVGSAGTKGPLHVVTVVRGRVAYHRIANLAARAR